MATEVESSRAEICAKQPGARAHCILVSHWRLSRMYLLIGAKVLL